MRAVVFTGFANINKVKLDIGFKSILGIGLKEGQTLTEQLLNNHYLKISDVTEMQISQFKELAKKANTKIEVI